VKRREGLGAKPIISHGVCGSTTNVTENISMKVYLITTGIIFGLITVAHIWRAVAEGSHLATDPVFILLTVLSAALCLWAFSLLKLSSRS
jgi:hypothetical protein